MLVSSQTPLFFKWFVLRGNLNRGQADWEIKPFLGRPRRVHILVLLLLLLLLLLLHKFRYVCVREELCSILPKGNGNESENSPSGQRRLNPDLGITDRLITLFSRL